MDSIGNRKRKVAYLMTLLHRIGVLTSKDIPRALQQLDQAKFEPPKSTDNAVTPLMLCDIAALHKFHCDQVFKLCDEVKEELGEIKRALEKHTL
jgi:hypothetical protein